MGAGEDLRAAVLEVAQAVPGSDKPVTLMADLTGPYDPATEDRPQAVSEVLVEFGQLPDLRNLSVQKAVALTGTYEAGDREFILPAALVTEAQLRTPDAYLVYGEARLDIVRIDAHEINFGVVATWRVVARERGRVST